MRKILLIMIFGLTVLISTALIPTAAALSELKENIKDIPSDAWSETKRIEFNEYLVYKFQASRTNTVEFTIEVTRGDSIDTLLFNSDNFTVFESMMQSGKAKPFYPYSEGKGMNLKYITFSFEIPSDGTYYLVEDNTYLPNNGGTPGGSVDVKMNFNKKRCLECEEAELEIQKRVEEATIKSEEAQRKLQEETNRNNESKGTPGFEIISSILVLTVLCLAARKVRR